jgi:hypothetical protein
MCNAYPLIGKQGKPPFGALYKKEFKELGCKDI